MFEKLEDQPRTPAGALVNPWVETAFKALATSYGIIVVELAQAAANAHFLHHRAQWLGPVYRPVTDVAVAHHNERVAARMAENASPDDPSLRPQIFQDLDAMQKLFELGKWGREES
jgi:hypothetical protein